MMAVFYSPCVLIYVFLKVIFLPCCNSNLFSLVSFWHTFLFFLPDQAKNGLMPAFNTEHHAQALMKLGCNGDSTVINQPLTVC